MYLEFCGHCQKFLTSAHFLVIPKFSMEGGNGSEVEREEDDSVSDILQDRFRLSAISIAENEGSVCQRDTLCTAAWLLMY